MLHDNDIAIAAANEGCVLSDRQRLADEIALHRVAALFRQEAELFLGLHAFSDDRHFETVAEVDDGANDRCRLRVPSEIHDKGAIDLHLLERERLPTPDPGKAPTATRPPQP